MKLRIGRISNYRDGIALGVMCCLAYAASYLGRINYSAAMADILAKQVLNRAQCGTLATVYFIVYGVGQLFNGIAADRCSPVSMISIGTLGAGMANLLMGLNLIYPLRVMLWGMNGFFQAMLWAPMLIVVSHCIISEQRNMVLFGLNAAPAFGTIAAYLMSSGLLYCFSWQSVFIGAGIALVVIGVLWILTCIKVFAYGENKEILTSEISKPEVLQCARQYNVFGLLLLSGAVWVIIASMVHGMLKDGITTWIPTYLMEEYALPAEIAVMITVIIPIVNVFGVFVGSKIVRILRNEVASVMLFFAVAVIALILLIVIPYWPVGICAGLLSIVTASMFGINVIVVSQMPIRFASQGKTGTISGIMNASAYLGCAVSTYGIAEVSERWGWGVTQVTWLIACFIALACCLVVVRKWSLFWKNDVLYKN